MSDQYWKSDEHCSKLEESLSGALRSSRVHRQTFPTPVSRSRPPIAGARAERRSGSYPVTQLFGLYRMKKSSLFSQLPREIATRIFGYLDIRSLILCQSVNKFWHDALWQAPHSISFSAYHSRPLDMHASDSGSNNPCEVDFPSFMRVDISCTKQEAVEGNWLVNARMLSSIATRAIHLSSLDLSDCLALEPSAFNCLQYLPQLQQLSLARTAVTNKECKALGRLPRLEGLNLFGCCIGDVGISYLGSLTQLQRLYMGGPWYHSNGVARIPSTFPTVAGFRVLGRCRSLQALHLRSIPLSVESHVALSSLVQLKELSIALGVDSPDLTPLMKEGSPVGAPHDLAFLSEMTQLECLRLDTLNQLTVDGVTRGLEHHTQLHTLLLPNCDVSLPVFVALQHLHLIRHLSFLSCSISASQMTSAYPLLQRLDCSGGWFFGTEESAGPQLNIPHASSASSTTPNTASSAAVVADPSSYSLNVETVMSGTTSSMSHLDLHGGSSSHRSMGSEAHFTPRGELSEKSSNTGVLSPLFQIPSLTQLELDLATKSDYFESIVAASSSLECLTIYDDEEEEEEGEEVRGSQTIRSAAVPTQTVSRLAALPNLTALVSFSVSLRNTWIASILETLLAAPHLKHVSLSTGFEAAHLPASFDLALKTLVNLDSIELRNFKHIASLDCIPHLTSLRSLYIAGLLPDPKTNIFNSVSQSSSIKRLGIVYSSSVTDADLRVIVKRMEQLEELDLTSLSRITDRTLHRLAKPGKGLKNLITIRLKYCPNLTPDGLLSLANLRKLYHIETTVQSRYQYSPLQSQVDLLFAKFSSNFVATN